MGLSYNLAALLDESARRHPDRVAVVHRGQGLTYADIERYASQVAHELVARGIGPGDKVALSCPNVPFFTIAYFGILKIGAAVVPLNVLLKGREVAYHLADSDARALLCFEDTRELPMCSEARQGFADTPGCEHFLVLTVDLNPAPTGTTECLAELIQSHPSGFDNTVVDEEATAVILYTSGTTGQPKGAELRHRNLRDNAFLSDTVFGSDASAPDVYLCALPLFHSFGQTCIQNSAVVYGGSVVMMQRFDARAALDLMASEHVSFFAGVPTMYGQLLAALGDRDDITEIARNLRVAASGGAALPVEIHRKFHDRFGITILEGYGLSETSPVASFGPWGEPPRPGSIGKPVAGVQMKLIDSEWGEVNPDGSAPDAVGEIAIRGHNVMKGYYRQREATAAALREGWFRSGDLGRRDRDGWYYVVGRSKELIIRGGYNVYPREIEEVLLTHPDVSLAAVVGVPCDSHGEEIKAVVILRPGATITSDELVTWGREQMATYKYPRIVEVVDTLPMTATGKILKRHLV